MFEFLGRIGKKSKARQTSPFKVRNWNDSATGLFDENDLTFMRDQSSDAIVRRIEELENERGMTVEMLGGDAFKANVLRELIAHADLQKAHEVRKALDERDRRYASVTHTQGYHATSDWLLKQDVRTLPRNADELRRFLERQR